MRIENDCRLAFARLLRELDLDLDPPADSKRPPMLRSIRGAAMPRKRRRAKGRPLPRGLAEITGSERTSWSVFGPMLETDDVTLGDGSMCRLWPDWPTWASFYASVRDELYGDRPWRRETSAAERLYAAFLRGDDMEAVRTQIDSDRRANDPRRRWPGGPS